jgi:hypothetical protein
LPVNDKLPVPRKRLDGDFRRERDGFAFKFKIQHCIMQLVLGLSDVYAHSSSIGWFDAQFMKFVFRYVLIPRACTADQFRAMVTKSKFGMCDNSEAPLGLEILLRE